ncbi:Eight transmembrane protein EpsH / EpsI protein [hydrothermal vent metagenome]|uniref:Eight transmembrane protein EpsH / EpsI protein n=1 Tax=hydrothermal vent metagenome TaxID=652676 RepID=A0A3B0YFA8_9ZZZZ
MNNINKLQIWKATSVTWIIFLVAIFLTGFIYYDGLLYLVQTWNNKEEYSHGFMIPAIALFFVWQKKDKLEQIPFEGSLAGVFVLLFGIGLFFLGELSTLYIIIQYSFLVAFYGLVLTWIGWRGVKIIWAPLLLLAFMIPLPGFLYNGLSAQLQLISSDLGVWVIRLFGISVYLEGNVIDLGTFKLQVVEACSGLRYLFPLMTLGFIIAYVYQAAFWKKAVVFLSAIPITVFMNSFRIGAIGVMVEYWGQSMAEGFLHDFEGWFVFMACLGVLLLEMLLLSKIGRDRKPLRDAFYIVFPDPAPKDAIVNTRILPRTLVASILVLAVAAVLSLSLGQREEIVPQRTDFSRFPLKIGDWKGMPNRMEQIYLDVLKLDDYIIADYADSFQNKVNFYVAYYGSQRKGESAHSPRTCLPGGGWQIASLTEKTVETGLKNDVPLKVNRVVIKKGESAQLVYYWFQGRNRVIANEYMVKWFLFWDALKKNRTDGALVRVTTLVRPGENIQDADRRVSDFVGEVSAVLSEYVPD